MVTQEHAEMVESLCKSGHQIVKELTPEDAHLQHMGLGLCGETGELIDAIKKVTIYRKSPDMENVIEELGDIEFYLQGIRQALDITREETLDANIKKLAKRYHMFKYSDKAAHDRMDKL
jgi:NTP pyrophosphatase (non-canonical NTP hydrolase)